MYYHKKQVNLPFDHAVIKIREELQKQGFGVLTEIDVKATLKKKLDVDFDNYVILGACNPPAAYQALQSEIDIGVYLPCNVIVYEKDKQTFVAAVLPTIAMSRTGNKNLEPIAARIEKLLKTAVDAV